jgi:lipopolysaccharide/colanic/teichoic acid biosynthesis glycosyltransferase
MIDVSSQSPATPFAVGVAPTFLRRLDIIARRLLDLGVALVGLVLLAPLFLLLGIMIKGDSPGPVFFRGARSGRHGKVFQILKFRTMHSGLRGDPGPCITAHDDPRTTPFGRWLRSTKLNELPQLWNVLKGDMSLVGPRPEYPTIVGQWPEEARRELLAARPGITSPASVLYRDEEKMLATATVLDDYLHDILPSKIRLERLYLRDRTVLTDLDVIFWTMIALLPGLRQASVPEYLLYWGPLARFASRHFSWFLVDLTVAFAAFGAVGILWRSVGPLDLGLHWALLLALGTSGLFSLINAAMGLHRVAWSHAKVSDAWGLAIASALATAGLIGFGYLVPVPFPSPVMLLMAGLFAFVGFLGVRYRIRILTGLASRWLQWRRPLAGLGERVLIVGTGETGRCAACLLRRHDLAGLFSIVGMVDEDPRKQGMRICECDVIGRGSDIPTLVERHDIGLVLVADGGVVEGTRLESQLSRLDPGRARVVRFPDVGESLLVRCQDPEVKRRRGSEAAKHGGVLPLDPGGVAAWLKELDGLLAVENIPACRTSIHDLGAFLGPRDGGRDHPEVTECHKELPPLSNP